MSLLLRVTASLIAVALAVGPVSAATASAATTTQTVAQASQMGTVKGIVSESSGAAIPGVLITAVGPTNTSTTSLPDGSYSLTLLAGIYQFNAQKTGYDSASTVDFAVVAGTTSPLNVTMAPVSLSTLREIGRVSVSRGRSSFNTSPASIATVSQQTFVDQGQLQLQRILDQTPGIVTDHPGTSVNNSSPGAINFPSIRGGLGFETASLIDGHPVAVQDFGDYVTTFLSTDVLQNIEVDKGPGAMPTTINYAINGTFNYRTLDPTSTQTGQIKLGYDSYGGTNGNVRYSNTFAKKIGILLDYGQYGTPGPLYNAGSSLTLPTGTLFNCPTPAAKTTTCQGQNGFTTNAIAGANTTQQNNPTIATTSLTACCFPVNTNYYNRTELAKLRLSFSSATVATLTYLGSQTYTDQNGNHVYNFPTIFCPSGLTGNNNIVVASCTNSSGAATYTGPQATGSAINTWQNVFTPNDFEINNEPIMEGELRTTLGHDTILGRYYTASINRLQYELTGPTTFDAFETMTVNGIVNLCPAGMTTCAAAAAKPTAFNNQVVNLDFASEQFTSPEEDHVHGGTLEYDHFLGSSGSVISAIFDQMSDTSDSFSWSGNPVQCAASVAFPGFCNTNPTIPLTSGASYSSSNGGNLSMSVVGGSAVRYTTYLLRGIFQLTPQLNLSLANYYDNYYTKFTLDGGYTYQSSSFNYDAPRAALELRVNPNVAIRASAGASIAPAYLNLFEGKSQGNPSYSTANLFATSTINNPNIKPETGFEYDLGGDFRISNDGATVLSIDGYTNTARNQFISQTANNGNVTVCNVNGGTLPSITSGGCGAAGTVTVPLVSTFNTNLDQVRFMGLEVSLKRDANVGFGYLAQGSLIQAYPYNVNPCIYYTGVTAVTTCSGPIAATAPNLAVINGDNFLNSATGGQGSYNSVSNHSEPYSNAYVEIHWRTAKGGYAGFGMQYYGPNNSLNLPAFWLANAEARFPLAGSKDLTFEVAMDNVFNVWNNGYDTEYGGVAVPLLDGKVGLTNQGTIGPRTARFYLTKNFGGY